MARKDIIKLLAGFKRFKEKYFETENSVYQKLSVGQSPKTLIIGCCDSRVDPAIISSASPGDIFVVRNVANLVPPYEIGGGFHGVSAAIEFAVTSLKVENVLILGHRQCGGIRSLFSENRQDDSFISQWMKIAKEARVEVLNKFPDADLETQCKQCELESIKVSLKNLTTFPFIQKAQKERDLNILGIYFDLEEGKLWEFDEKDNEFKNIEV
ncbi:MAG: carbonic anhydrase [Bdellovibrionaceae bacterium]|nr:carbonic anhydrase [Pseudobdellovibrionaceae bacterium]NUM58931.1 carbonic anhydrase [Pseudobdellovibrionaceae bacterium]